MTWKVAVVILWTLLATDIAFGRSTYLSAFNTKYGTSATVLNTCSLCHPGGSTSQRNQFALDFANSTIGNHTFSATLEARDSDGDTFSNLAEIQARTFPGDPNSKPANPPPGQPKNVIVIYF